MDDLTHALAGTLIARANPSKKRGLLLACVLGCLAPDLDIVLAFFSRHLYLVEHRGFTHSLLGLIPMSLLAASLGWLFYRKKEDRASFLFLWSMAVLGVVSHILLDWCTSWGTMMFWPNHTRLSLDQLFIIDPWYDGVLLIPIVLSSFFKKHRVSLCLCGLLLALGYHGLTAYNHFKAIQIVEQDSPQSWCAAFPQLFSPFRWCAYSRQEGHLKRAVIDFLISSHPLEWKEWEDPVMTPNLRAAMDSPQGRQYLWFARVPIWREEKQSDGSSIIHFWDLRFHNGSFDDSNSRRFGAIVEVKDGKVLGGQF